METMRIYTKQQLFDIRASFIIALDKAGGLCNRLDEGNKGISEYALKYLEDNKPSQTLHHHFYIHSTFRPKESYWWLKNKEGYQKRKDFLLYLIRQLTKLIDDDFVIDKKKFLTIEERLKEFKFIYPKLRRKVDLMFPELKDTKPFVKEGTLLMRKGFPKNIYVICYKQERGFYVRSVVRDAAWTSSCKASNQEKELLDEYYLTEFDFDNLLRLSLVSLKQFRIINEGNLESLYSHLFKFPKRLVKWIPDNDDCKAVSDK